MYCVLHTLVSGGVENQRIRTSVIFVMSVVTVDYVPSIHCEHCVHHLVLYPVGISAYDSLSAVLVPSRIVYVIIRTHLFI